MSQHVCGLCGAPNAERICDVYRCIPCMTMGAEYVIKFDDNDAADDRAEYDSETYLNGDIMDLDWSDLAVVVRLAARLGGGSTVVKYPTRDNYNIVLDYVSAEREGAEVAWHPSQN